MKIKRKYIIAVCAALLILLPGAYFALVWDDLAPVVGAFSRLGRLELFAVGFFEPRDVILRRFAQTLYASAPLEKNIRFETLLENFCSKRDRLLKQRLKKKKKIKRKHILKMTDLEYQEALDILVETELYLAKFDKEKYCQEGLDRLTSPREKYDYSYLAVEALYRKLRLVDRRRVLSAMFNQIVGSEKDHIRRHELVLDFLAQGVFQAADTQPLNRQKRLINDPLVLLELHNMRCGNINRIACDLFAAAGYQTRIVQLYNHVIAEIYYDSSWHYFDADTVLSADSIVKIDGKIPDTKTLSRNPHLWDKKDFYFDSVFRQGTSNIGGAFMYQCQLFQYPADKSPLYYVKTATPAKELGKNYGWNYYRKSIADDIVTSPVKPAFYRPSAPSLETLSVQGAKIALSFHSHNYSSDLAGYQLFVSKKSRGWDYPSRFCSEAVKRYIHPISVFTTAHYKSMSKMPPSEILQLKSADGKFSFDLPPGVYYITCKSCGRHGGGDSWTMPSNELQVRIGQ